MLPLSKTQFHELANNNSMVTYAVHKFNPYIAGKTIELDKAVRCVICQSKWAANHDMVDSESKAPLAIDVNILSQTFVEGLGLFIQVQAGDLKVSSVFPFIVNESESHWYFLDMGMACASKRIEIV